jgi:protein TonB
MDAERVADSPTLSERVRSFLGWAFVISAAVHVIVGGLMPYQRYSDPRPVRVDILTRRSPTIVVVPTPPPTPTPPPPTKNSPPPVQSSNPPPVRILPPVTHNDGDSSARPRYTPAPAGRDDGFPNATGTSAPVVTSTTSASATAAPIPTPTPRSCSQPHQDAATTQKAEADYPEIARQQGAVGTVTVRVNLSATGSVAGLNVYKSSGIAALDAEALKAARNSRYSPEIEDCQKVAGQYLFVVDFTSQ